MNINNLINENTYLISDTHFCDHRMIKYEPSRTIFANSDDINDIDNAMIKAWNETIKEDDVVLHLGDYAFKNIERITGLLNGIKILLRGNHDKQSADSYILRGFKYAIEAPHYEINNKVYKDINNQDRYKACYIKTINNKKILFSHFPLFGHDYKDPRFPDMKAALEEIYNDFNCDINIHGHTHSYNLNNTLNINVSLENINFKPIQLKHLL